MVMSRSRAALTILVAQLVHINGQVCPENPGANKTRIGNGWCNGNPANVWMPNETGPVLNTASCYYDGGDCCQSTCEAHTYRRACEYGSPGCYRCGVNGYDCVDPWEPAYLTVEPRISWAALYKDDGERLDVAMRRFLDTEGRVYQYHDFYNIPNESTCLSKFSACYGHLDDEWYIQGCLIGAEANATQSQSETVEAEGQCVKCPDELSSANAAECVGSFPEGITIASIPDIYGEDKKKLDILVSKVHDSSQFGLASAALSVSFDADDMRMVFVHAFLNVSNFANAGYTFIVNDDEYVYFGGDGYASTHDGEEIFPAWFGVYAQKSTAIKNIKIYGRSTLEEEHGARVLINGLAYREGPLFANPNAPPPIGDENTGNETTGNETTGNETTGDEATGASTKSVGAPLIGAIASALLGSIGCV